MFLAYLQSFEDHVFRPFVVVHEGLFLGESDILDVFIDIAGDRETGQRDILLAVEITGQSNFPAPVTGVFLKLRCREVFDDQMFLFPVIETFSLQFSYRNASGDVLFLQIITELDIEKLFLTTPFLIRFFALSTTP